jgi:phosphoglycolate phosphatase-like HAD superfamily hydrolase
MDKREWSLVYKNIPHCSFYPYVIESIKRLRENNIKITIVSNSPSIYVSKVLKYYNIYIDYIVCYHDVIQHKPNPEGVYKVLNHLSLLKTDVVYIGDNDIDFNTANNAQIQFFGVPWGNFSQQVEKIDYNILGKIKE